LTDLSFVLSQYTRVTDGQTDGRTEFLSLYRVCITCSTVKTSRVTWCAFSHIWGRSIFAHSASAI